MREYTRAEGSLRAAVPRGARLEHAMSRAGGTGALLALCRCVGLFSRVALVTATFAAVHSALASRRVKEAAYRRIPHARAFYRVAYNSQALGTFGVLVWMISREPKVTLYRVRGAAASLMRLGQISGVVLAVLAARATGVATLAGLDTLPLPAARGPRRVDPPAAQGPESGADGRLRVRGPFAVVRHPLNLAPLMPFWLTPHMTSRRLAFNIIATLYLVAGSIHEETRLLAQYGDDYERYRRSGVPFYVPRLRRIDTTPDHPDGVHL